MSLQLLCKTCERFCKSQNLIPANPRYLKFAKNSLFKVYSHLKVYSKNLLNCHHHDRTKAHNIHITVAACICQAFPTCALSCFCAHAGKAWQACCICKLFRYASINSEVTLLKIRCCGNTPKGAQLHVYM